MRRGVSRIQAGRRTIKKLTAELIQYARRRAVPTATAAELAQECWVAAIRLYRGEAPLRGFLYQVQRRQITTYLRDLLTRPGLRTATLVEFDPDSLLGDEEHEPGPDAIAIWRRVELVRAAIPLIPPRFRQVLELKLAGHENRAIAKLLGINYHTARSRYVRALDELDTAIALVRAGGRADAP
jgi:RNA polymerase sigma factor (sigma-70 family)